MEALVYLAPIVVAVAIGFVFAMWLSVKGMRDGEREWAERAVAGEESGHEAALAGSGAHHTH